VQRGFQEEFSRITTLNTWHSKHSILIQSVSNLENIGSKSGIYNPNQIQNPTEMSFKKTNNLQVMELTSKLP